MQSAIVTDYSSSLYKDIVHHDVGSELKRFSIHKGLITKESDYFKAAFTGNFAEGTSSVIKLEEHKPEAVEWFITWLYSRRLIHDTEGKIDVDLDMFQLSNLHIFADAVDVPKLRWATTDAVIKNGETKYLRPKVVDAIYNNLPDNTPLRPLLVQWFIADFNEPENEGGWPNKSWLEECPAEFSMDVALTAVPRLKDSKATKIPWDSTDKCGDYHKHKDGEKCNE